MKKHWIVIATTMLLMGILYGCAAWTYCNRHLYVIHNYGFPAADHKVIFVQSRVAYYVLFPVGALRRYAMHQLWYPCSVDKVDPHTVEKI